MARITASTWGPSVRRSRLLYSAVARPIMTYGSQIWSINENGSPIAPSKTAELEKVQNKCLRRILGAYKRTPVAALERESGVPPLKIYLESLATQRAVATTQHSVTDSINSALKRCMGGGQQEAKTERTRAPPSSTRRITRLSTRDPSESRTEDHRDQASPPNRSGSQGPRGNSKPPTSPPEEIRYDAA